jgi:serine/threonine protein kinase
MAHQHIERRRAQSEETDVLGQVMHHGQDRPLRPVLTAREAKRITLVNKIGEGGFGVVWEAFDKEVHLLALLICLFASVVVLLQLMRSVALKRVCFDSQVFPAALLRELLILGRVAAEAHPHIVQMLGVVESALALGCTNSWLYV